jgi:hypothetical protein
MRLFLFFAGTFAAADIIKAGPTELASAWRSK